MILLTVVGLAERPVAAAADPTPSLVSCDALGDAAALDDAARPAPDAVLHLTFELNSTRVKDMSAFAAEQTNPKSPCFRHWLTPAQVGENFGADDSQIAAVVRDLSSKGFKNVKIWPNRLFLSFPATRAQAEQAFGVSVKGYSRTSAQMKRGLSKTYYAADRAPTVDSVLSANLVGFFGLSSIGQHAPTAEPAKNPHLSPNGSLDPPDLSKAYDITALQSLGLTGAGETIAIFSPAAYSQSDVDSFFQQEDLQEPAINVVQVNGGITDLTNQVEPCIDIETIGGQVPDATINVYEGPNDGSMDIFNQIAADNPDVVSVSWGTDEDQTPSSVAAAYETLRMTMAMQGISIFVASGDWGAFDYNNNTTLTVSVDTSSAYVTSVGGTELTLGPGGSWGSEVAWTYGDGTTGGDTGSSGGLSVFFKQPSWQTGTGVANSYSDGYRQVPDIAACASTPYYDIFTEGGFSLWAGTSCSCPLCASAISLISEGLGQRLGNIDPTLYAAASPGNTVYHDITSGSNGHNQCTVGWDYVTGWGSIDFGHLYSAFQSTALPPIISFSPPFGPVGTQVTISGTHLANATGIAFNDIPATLPNPVTTNGNTVVTVPPNATTGAISVTTVAGTVYSLGNFTVGIPPTIATITPSGTVGSSITITGTNLGTVNGVAFNNVFSNFYLATPNYITANVPAGATSGAIAVDTPTGIARSLTDFIVTVPPTITSFTPSGAIASNVTINGTGLAGATSVSFNGDDATTFSASATAITATVPQGATTGTITVVTPGGTVITASNFIVTVPPTITSFTPSGAVGSLITITGTGLLNVTAVVFNSTIVTTFTASTSQITVRVPGGAANGPITLVSPYGNISTIANFDVLSLPVVASLNPTSGPAGTVVTVTGSGFTGVTAISVDGYPATFTFVSDSDVTVTIPTGASTGAIHVKTAAGLGASSTNFVVTGPPVVSSFLPTSGPIGTVVTVTGTGFTGTTAASVDGCPAAYTFVSDTEVRVTVPNGASTGAIHIKDISLLGSSTTNFAVTGAPIISSFNPTSGSVGTVVTVTGSGFTSLTAASINGYPAAFTFMNDTTVTLTVPAGASTGPIHIKTAVGLAASSTNVIVLPTPSAPVIASFSPPAGPSGTVVTIMGSGFTGLTAVSLDGYPAAFTFVNDGDVTFTVPGGAGTGAIHIKTPYGLGSSTPSFTVTGPPVVSNFLPTSGPVGTVVTVSGSGFTGITAASVGGYPAVYTFVNDGTVTLTIPKGAGTGAIHIKNSLGLGVSTTTFTVN
jgi:subtilase family serine protease